MASEGLKGTTKNDRGGGEIEKKNYRFPPPPQIINGRPLMAIDCHPHLNKTSYFRKEISLELESSVYWEIMQESCQTLGHTQYILWSTNPDRIGLDLLDVGKKIKLVPNSNPVAVNHVVYCRTLQFLRLEDTYGAKIRPPLQVSLNNYWGKSARGV